MRDPEDSSMTHESQDASTLGACLRAAELLLRALQDEADLLKRFDSQALLEFLSHKEFLVCDLEQRLSALRDSAPHAARLPDSGDSLRTVLRQIDGQNQANALWTQGTLKHWQDFLSVFCPPGSYSPGQDERAMRRPNTLKGLAFSKEV